MRKAALSSLVLALAAAGAAAVAAAGGGHARSNDVAAANLRTAHAASVHYRVDVRMTKAHQPLTLRIAGAASHDQVAVHLRLGDLKLKDGTTLPGTTGAIVLSTPFLYERVPSGIAVFGRVRWLRLPLTDVPPRSQVLSTVRALTPAPLLRVVAEAKLHPSGRPGGFAGTVAYDDPVVRTALHALAGGVEFRGLRLYVHVAGDGFVHTVRLTGRTADGKTTLALHARLHGFGSPVLAQPPKPGTFLDQQLSQLGA